MVAEVVPFTTVSELISNLCIFSSSFLQENKTNTTNIMNGSAMYFVIFIIICF